MQVTQTNLREEALTLFARLVAQSDPGRLAEWANLGLTLTQARVLALLETDQGLRAGDLATRLEVQPSTVTRIVDRLVRDKLVRRDADPDDRRMVRHFVTHRGIDTLARLRRSGRARFDEVFGNMGEDRLANVVEALRLLTETFEAVDHKESA
jgi:DNA-binding MarR family transcriptional regulator